MFTDRKRMQSKKSQKCMKISKKTVCSHKIRKKKSRNETKKERFCCNEPYNISVRTKQPAEMLIAFYFRRTYAT